MRTIGSAFDLTPGGGAFDLGTTNGYLYNVQPGTLFADHFTGFERFAPDGERLERIEHFVGDTTGLPLDDVITLEGGGIAAIFTFGAGSYRPYVRLYDADGKPVTEYMEVPTEGDVTPGNQGFYAIQAEPDGGFAVMVGYDPSNADERAVISPKEFGNRSRLTDVRLVEYNADGTLKRAPYIAHETADPTSWTDANVSKAHAVLANGDIVVAYTDDFYGLVPRAQLSAGGGASFSIVRDGAVLTETAVYVPPWAFINGTNQHYAQTFGQTDTKYAPSVVALDTGGFAVIYAHAARKGVGKVEWVAKFYTDDGNQTARIDLDKTAHFQGDNGSPSFVAMAGGKIGVVSSLNTSLTGREVHVTIFDASGASEGRKVGELGVAQQLNGIDGINVGSDGSLYVSLNDGRVFRYIDDEAARAPGVDGVLSGLRRAELGLGTSGDERFVMKGGADRVYAGGGDDTVNGQAGNDHLEGQTGNDRMIGGAGADVLLGQGGADTLNGGNGNDDLFGGSSGDILRGGKGRDTLWGGAGRDELDGGEGNDALHGGADEDRFVFGAGRDVIADFQDDVDTLVLDSALWTGDLTRKQVVRQFASVQDGGVLFDFGTDSVFVDGIDARSRLVDDILLG